MSERTTLARPYAEAAFRLAQEKKALKAWSEMLALAAAVAADPRMATLRDDPRVARSASTEFFVDVCGKKLDQDGANFIRVLADNHRLALLPEIAALFEKRRAEAERRIEAEVVSAFEMKPEQLAGIAGALKKKLGRDIDIVSKVDASLIGGVVIRAGDLVIDGSVQGRLGALTTHLTR